MSTETDPAKHLLKAPEDSFHADESGIADEDGEESDKNLLPLHCAAWYNRLRKLKWLLKNGTGNK